MMKEKTGYVVCVYIFIYKLTYFNEQLNPVGLGTALNPCKMWRTPLTASMKIIK